MKVNINGITRDMTPEEEKAFKRETTMFAIEEARRSLTTEEVSRMLITQQINTLDVDDNTALRMREFYPEWKLGLVCDIGFKTQRGGRLWKCIQAHTTQDGWEPENAASLWTEINETHSGTEDDPIPYNGNMVLESGKYYMEDYVVYFCNRDTVNPVFNPLSDLIGLYVEAI